MVGSAINKGQTSRIELNSLIRIGQSWCLGCRIFPLRYASPDRLDYIFFIPSRDTSERN